MDSIPSPFDRAMYWNTNKANNNSNNPPENRKPPSWLDWLKNHVTDIAIVLISITVIVVVIYFAVRAWFRRNEKEEISYGIGKCTEPRKRDPLADLPILD